MATPRWKGFERLAEKVAIDLAKEAEVKWNDHILGQDSTANRQIDVSVRWREGDKAHLLVIDAKDWRTPADVNDIGSFSALLRDVRASSGMLVCNAGFTANAQTYARNLGIGISNLHDAESRDWSRDLTVPIIWTELTPQVSFAGLIHFEAGDSPVQDADFPVVLSPDDGRSVAKPTSTFIRMWNEGQLRRDVNMDHWISDGRVFKALVRTETGENVWRPVHEFGLKYTVKRDAWLGQFNPTECRGLIDYLDGQSFLVSYMPLDQIPATRDDSWQSVEDPEQVALSIRGSIVTTESVQILDAAGAVFGETGFKYMGENVPDSSELPFPPAH